MTKNIKNIPKSTAYVGALGIKDSTFSKYGNRKNKKSAIYKDKIDTIIRDRPKLKPMIANTKRTKIGTKV